MSSNSRKQDKILFNRTLVGPRSDLQSQCRSRKKHGHHRRERGLAERSKDRELRQSGRATNVRSNPERSIVSQLIQESHARGNALQETAKTTEEYYSPLEESRTTKKNTPTSTNAQWRQWRSEPQSSSQSSGSLGSGKDRAT